jgi:hypothetical protein
MRRPILLALFFAFFLSTLEARANIYGLIAMAENPALNAMQGGALMLASYEEAYYYDIYLESYLYEGSILRSSGAAFGSDGYPAYNGFVAIVNTQNTLDYDNPDPHDLYGDFYLGAYFYYPIPGGFLWYDPYGYSFFGGDYPAEYTFLPCYCGGYQVYQLIYLGSLELVYPKNQLEMVAYEDTLALAGEAASIPRTNQYIPAEDLTNKTIPIQVGERLTLGIVVRNVVVPPNAILNNFVWTWDGQAIEDWKVSHNGERDQLSRTFIADVDYLTNPIKIMWYSGDFSGASYTLRVVFRVNTRLYTRKVTFKVYRPQITVTSSILPTPTVDSLYDNSGEWTLHLGLRNSSVLPGINFIYSNLNVPNGFGTGNLQWVQVIKRTTRNNYNDDASEEIPLDVEDVLDTEYPYTYANPAYDSPVHGFTTLYTRNEADDEFKMYLMYLPQRSRYYSAIQWVTLKTISWGWKGSGRVFVNRDTGQIDDGVKLSGSVTSPTVVDEIEYPEWGRNITYYTNTH